MAQRIVWTAEAENDRLEILEFWFKITGSKRYSQKLNKQFRDHLKTILEYPEIGVKTKIQNVRAKTVGNYQLFYLLTVNSVILLHIWDSRQNPGKLKYKGIDLWLSEYCHFDKLKPYTTILIYFRKCYLMQSIH